MMQVSGFAELTPRQQHAMLIAMRVCNAMEDFHVEHLSDKQMAALNPIIRQAIFDTLVTIEQVDDPDTEGDLAWLIRMIRDSWEIPNAGYRITEK
ncbi:hypothetical protein [Microbacterium sp. Bi128]|uniref:hypothetical protein n=1 Tax=Microbacterium sp. Bi128 TaxID=2821115 RepID=UPI001D681F83|nr:hypothetical protein [Microbacterium sp. Bi128]CAH0165335.1 hypothetical protein SRABI128_00896 [Microbacterium sp. Bi128]